ncbi:mechanosensitive ion channel family protein [Pedobacter frigiditerrae]|uniref:Mechanosensitive ion channel family protein n=1 Tax=Pedobacter frigiditerrae TaxID=2530452 RepID=A0A4R0N1W4_9SPHI|nr:mechanosensitive ion channel family protein [Pedobacter frigiditerrae]TCC93730.1 mechanosensitive ion channel family protein [Pedobacter frigiditerrae]
MDNQFFEQVIWGNTVQAYCMFAGIILLGLLLKRFVSKRLSQLLFKLFKKFAEEVKIDTFIALLLKPFEFFISLATLYLAVNQLKHPLEVVVFHFNKQINNVKTLQPFTLGELLDKTFLFLIILSFFWIILRIIDFIAHVFTYKAIKSENKADDQLVPFLKELFKFVIYFIGFFVLLGYVFEVNALSLITGLGIGGIAIALAAKETLENLIASFTIFIDKPFTVGDLVKVDGIEGTVEKVGFRSTVFRSTDKTTIIIPNRAMIDGVLENMTRRNYRRVKFNIGITYETDSALIKNIIEDINAFLEQSEHTTDASVTFDSFADSALNIQVLYLVENIEYNNYLKIKEDVNFKIIDIVNQHGSEFAYPTQRTVGEKNK